MNNLIKLLSNLKMYNWILSIENIYNGTYESLAFD